MRLFCPHRNRKPDSDGETYWCHCGDCGKPLAITPAEEAVLRQALLASVTVLGVIRPLRYED